MYQNFWYLEVSNFDNPGIRREAHRQGQHYNDHVSVRYLVYSIEGFQVSKDRTCEINWYIGIFDTSNYRSFDVTPLDGYTPLRYRIEISSKRSILIYRSFVSIYMGSIASSILPPGRKTQSFRCIVSTHLRDKTFFLYVVEKSSHHFLTPQFLSGKRYRLMCTLFQEQETRKGSLAYVIVRQARILFEAGGGSALTSVQQWVSCDSQGKIDKFFLTATAIFF